MRVKAEELNKRMDFVRNFYSSRRDASVADVQEALKKEFDSGMTPSRITKIRKEVLRGPEGLRSVPKEQEDEAVPESFRAEYAPAGQHVNGSGRTEERSKTKRPGRPSKERRLDNERAAAGATPEQESKAIEKCRSILEEIGASQIHISYSIERDLTY